MSTLHGSPQLLYFLSLLLSPLQPFLLSSLYPSSCNLHPPFLLLNLDFHIFPFPMVRLINFLSGTCNKSFLLRKIGRIGCCSLIFSCMYMYMCMHLCMYIVTSINLVLEID